MKSFDIASKIRESVRNLKPYSSARDDFQGAASVYLDANENPNNTGYNRYPDPHQRALKKKIASIRKVHPDQIFLGNGSDEPIDLLIRAFCQPGIDNVLIPEPTYGMYSVSAAINDVAIKKVSLTAEFDLDVDSVEQSWDANTRILFLCSPNNPSGNLLSPDRIKKLLVSFDGLVIVDEAYIDFTDVPGFLSLLPSYPNLVVLQTLSKAWGLAGIRLGMCFAQPGIIQVLDKIKPPYNINTLTQTVALESLEHERQKNEWVIEIKKQREILKAELINIKQVEKVYPSEANFLLVRIGNAKRIYDGLVLKGIIVRDRSTVTLCSDCLRITVGTPPENKILIDALNQL
jgi:histidinol-phosphate aminotransferase